MSRKYALNIDDTFYYDEENEHNDNKQYLFKDDDTAEEFVVCAECMLDAIDIADEFFSSPRMISRISKIEAEQSGLDLY